MYTTDAAREAELVALMLFGGPQYVLYGLSRLMEMRLIRDTARSKVSSAAMGLVELRGTTEAQFSIKAPACGLPCVWWGCRVEEYVSDGKYSNWQTIKVVNSPHSFYLVDETGKVAINPRNAEVRVPEGYTDVDSSTRSALTPALESWGIDPMRWSSLAQPIRIVEKVIGLGWPVFVFGELTTLVESPDSLEARRRAYITAAKNDAARMAAADKDKDGQVDAQEWDALRESLETDFDTNERKRRALIAAQESVMVHAPETGDFVISCESEQYFYSTLSWQGPASMAGGLVATTLGVWFAIMLNWSPVLIVVLIGGAFITRMLFKKGALI